MTYKQLNEMIRSNDPLPYNISDEDRIKLKRIKAEFNRLYDGSHENYNESNLEDWCYNEDTRIRDEKLKQLGI